jgi:hypothetical protein
VNRRVLLRVLALGALALLGACRATYTGDRIRDTIVQMCRKEYGVAVDVQTAGRTLGAVITTDDLLQSDLTLSDRALKKLENVILTVSRVTLSSEFPYEFFVVVVRDPKAGVQVSFVRYLKDVRRLLTDDISRNEYFQRMLIEVEMLPVGLPGAAYRLPEVRLADFICRQIAERMRQEIDANVVVSRLFRLENVDGAYEPLPRPGERTPLSGNLRLRLIFHPDAPPFATIASPTLRDEFLQTFLRTARTVTRRYEFQAFEGLDLVDGAGLRLAYFDRKAFSQDSVNTLMDLIRSLKDKGK